MNKPQAFQFHEIKSTADPVWPGWREIYLASFPPNEQMTLEFFDRILASPGSNDNWHVLSLKDTDNHDHVVCIACYCIYVEKGICLLLYLATGAGVRRKGYGAEMYRQIRDRSYADGADLVVFEVEIPEIALMKSVEDAEWALRRIHWYERMGAVMVQGIRYTLSVDSTDVRTPMHLMVHSANEPDSEELFDRLSGVFGNAIEKLGPISLTRATV